MVAATTTRIHLGTMVLNNDMRNPVQLAWEASTLQHLSDGRFELGLGAGHTPQEFRSTGVAFDPAPVRKARLAESVEIIAALLRGGPVDHDGRHYRIAGAEIDPPATPPPIVVGGNGSTLLRHAARLAGAIGLQGLGRTPEDGHRHTARCRLIGQRMPGPVGAEELLAVVPAAVEAVGSRLLHHPEHQR